MKAVSNPRWANDPFAALLMPPPDETEDQRAERVHQQAEAARVSREIDESLQEAKKLVEKRKKATKVLLLGKSIPLPRTSRAFITSPGQAESGKSTTLKSEHTPSLLPVILFLMIGATDHRLPALLLSFSIQTGEGSLENRHPAQSHQVTTPRALALCTILTPFLDPCAPSFRSSRMIGIPSAPQSRRLLLPVSHARTVPSAVPPVPATRGQTAGVTEIPS
jgi:hypothetical protein